MVLPLFHILDEFDIGFALSILCKSLVKAITVIPLLFLNMLLNMFRSHSKNNKEFIHTQHGKENENSN